MTDRSMFRGWVGAGLLACAGCFNGQDALGLPCEEDFQCGNGQVCADGTCALEGDATGGGSGSASETPGSSETLGSSEASGSSETSGSLETSGSSGSSTGGPGPMAACFGALTSREIVISGSANPMSVGVGRFSNGRDADIVVLTRSPARLSVFRFDGDGFQLEGETNVDDEPMDLAVGSLDGDEYDDVVVVDGGGPNAGAVTLFWGAAGGLFADPQTSFDDPLSFPYSVDIGQMLNNESRQFVVSSGTAANASVLFEVTDREPSLRSSYPSVSASPWDTVLVDLNGAPPLEAIVVGSNDEGLDQESFPGSDGVHVLSASSKNGLSSLQVLEGARSPFGVDAGDLDGDGIPEVIFVGKNIDTPAAVVEKSDNPSEVSLCSRDESGDPLECSTWEPGPDHTGYSNIRLADLDGDGHLDAVIGTTGGTAAADGRLLLARGPLLPDFVPVELADTGPIGNKMAIADVTGDGAPDIVVPLYGVGTSGQGVVRVYSCEVEGS